MNRVSLVLLHVLIINYTTIWAQDSSQNFNQAINNVSNSLKSLWTGGQQFIEGMGQSFGIVSSDYYNNFIVFNDAPNAIFVAKQHITGIMGAKFSGDIENSMTLGAGQNSGETFKQQQLYAAVWLCGNINDLGSYAKSSTQGTQWGSVVPLVGTALGAIIGGVVTTEKLEAYKIFSRNIDLGKKNDPNWYYYRTYTYQGQVQGEYLGVKAKSTEFAGVFFNNTAQPNIYFSFTKDGTDYTVNLEPNSYSLLQSTSGVAGSIRPQSGKTAAFQFYNTSNGTFNDSTSIAFVNVPEIGIANISIDPQTQAQTVEGPMTYTYEIHLVNNQPTLGIQGLAVGHYDQPCGLCKQGQPLSLVRDINPAQCHIWLMSADQTEKQAAAQAQGAVDTSAIYYDSSDQIWISYQTQDYVYQQKITPGSVLDFGLIRPRLSEKQAILYVVALQTTDDVAAKKFLNRLSTGKIGQGAVYTAVTADTLQQFLAGKTNLVVSPQPNTNGIIDDTNIKTDSAASGIKGLVLLADIFTPRGIGIGPFYYIIQASSLQIGFLMTGLYLADNNYNADRTLKDAVIKDLSSKLVSWINAYKKDQNSVKNNVTTYLQQNGNQNLFSNPQASAGQRQFTDAGMRMLNDFLTGPISIANPPLIGQASKNYYVYALGSAPDGWLTSTQKS